MSGRVRTIVPLGAMYDRESVRFDFAVPAGTLGFLLEPEPNFVGWNCIEVTDEHGRAAWCPARPSQFEPI
jgi:hypothetical protein